MEKRNKVLVLYGATASGKTTLSRALAVLHPERFHLVRSYSTRPMRLGEEEGVDYFFTDNEHFASLRQENKVISPRTYHVYTGDVWNYGVNVEDMEDGKWTVMILDPQGLSEYIENVLKFNMDPETFRCVQVYAPAIDRMKRYIPRVSSDDEVYEFCRRMLDDEEQLKIHKDVNSLPVGQMKIICGNKSDLQEEIERISHWIEEPISKG